MYMSRSDPVRLCPRGDVLLGSAEFFSPRGGVRLVFSEEGPELRGVVGVDRVAELV